MNSYFLLVLVGILGLASADLGRDSTGDTSTTGGGFATSSGNFVTTGLIFINTTSSNLTECELNSDCDTCAKDVNCIWCQGSSTCASGHWFGPSGSCSDWRWKQCQINGKYALLGAAGGFGLIILCFTVCICCCCCCQKRRLSKKQVKNFKEFKSIQMEEEGEGLISKHPKSDSRRAELMKKYGSKINTTSNA